jgi:NAD(P)-dependent dehydrogenase (short-subunit alcohol dehydrogenase family)
MSSQLEGKVCVITGTGGSMGRAPTLASAREGAFVLVDCDRSVDAAHATVELRPGSRGDMPSQHPCHLDVSFNLVATADFNRLEGITDELAADTSSPVTGADIVVDSTTTSSAGVLDGGVRVSGGDGVLRRAQSALRAVPRP